MDDSGHPDPLDESVSPEPSGEQVDGVGGPRPADLDRLPPPAFPPGTRRRQVRQQAPSRAMASREGNGDVPDDAFIDPDEPMHPGSGGVPEDAFFDPDAPLSPAGSGMPEDAFIDPDAPIVRTAQPQAPDDYEEVLRGGGQKELEEGEVLVTGIGDDPHLDDEDLRAAQQYGDPHVADLVERVKRLADALEAKGEVGLKVESGMVHFEATLRAYCVGYLAGRRESEAG